MGVGGVAANNNCKKHKGRQHGEAQRTAGQGDKREGGGACRESKRKRERHPVQMATQLIATLTHKMKCNCLWKCRQTTTRARNTTTSHQPMLISTHPGFLSLAFIHSVSLKPAKMDARAQQARAHAHKPIFHPKIHEGKSLSSSPSHSFSSTLEGTVPSSVPALPLKSFWIFWQTIFPSLHTPHALFPLASAQSGSAPPPPHPPLHEIIYIN